MVYSAYPDRWLHLKPDDLDLNCFLKKIHPGLAGQRLRFYILYIK